MTVEMNWWAKAAAQAAAECLAAEPSHCSGFFFSLWEEGIITTGVRWHMLCLGFCHGIVWFVYMSDFCSASTYYRSLSQLSFHLLQI